MAFKDEKLSKEIKKKISEAKKGKPSWNKGTKGIMKPNKTSFKKGQNKGKTPWNKGVKASPKVAAILRVAALGRKMSAETRKKISEAQKGDKGNNWKGGITHIHQLIRTSAEYKLWREAVFERDDYTCIWCGVRSGRGTNVTLNADHIKPFALFPELRFAIDNGRTLCEDCHKTTNTYGRKE